MDINKNIINFLGYYDKNILTLEIDHKNMILIVKNSTSEPVHSYIHGTYIEIELYRNKNMILRTTVKGPESSLEAAQKLNNVKFEKGDYFRFYHVEPNRMNISGIVENTSIDLSNSCSGINLDNGYFYTLMSTLFYSDKLLTIEECLDNLIREAEKLPSEDYDILTYVDLKNALKIAKDMKNNVNSSDRDFEIAFIGLQIALNNLRKKSKVICKGENNEIALQIVLSYEGKSYIAKGASSAVAPSFGNNPYIEIEVCNKKGIKKLSYTVRGNDDTLKIANILSSMHYEQQDYMKIYHKEGATKLSIEGFIENEPFDLSTGFKEIDLTAYFLYMDDKRETFTYSNKMKEISYDKSSLEEFLNQLKSLQPQKILKESYDNFEKVVEKGKTLLETPFVSSDEIKHEIATIEEAKNYLKWKTRVEFRGVQYASGELEFLGLEIDPLRKIIKVQKLHNQKIHPEYFGDTLYASIKLMDKNGNIKIEESATGSGTADGFVEKFRNYPYEKGDYLEFYYAEPNKIRIKGYLENAPYDMSTNTGCQHINLSTSRFYLGKDYLVYKNVESTRFILKNLIGFLVQNEKLLENIDFQKDIVEIEKLVTMKNIKVEVLEEAILKLKKIYRG